MYMLIISIFIRVTIIRSMPALTKIVFAASLEQAYRAGFAAAGGQDECVVPDLTMFDCRDTCSGVGSSVTPGKLKLDPVARSELPYDSSKCDRRIWNEGYGAQCSHSKKDGGNLCSSCAKSSNTPPFGFVTEPRPIERPNGTAIAWKDQATQKPPSMTIMREYLSGRGSSAGEGLKKLELFKVYTYELEQEAVEKAASSRDLEDSDLEDSDLEDSQESQESQESQVAGRTNKRPKSKKAKAAAEKAAAEKAKVAADKEKAAAKAAAAEVESDSYSDSGTDDSGTDDMSGSDSSDLEEDLGPVEEVEINGIPYIHETKSNHVYNTNMKQVGTWNSETKDITWEDDRFRQAHLAQMS